MKYHIILVASVMLTLILLVNGNLIWGIKEFKIINIYSCKLELDLKNRSNISNITTSIIRSNKDNIYVAIASISEKENYEHINHSDSSVQARPSLGLKTGSAIDLTMVNSASNIYQTAPPSFPLTPHNIPLRVEFSSISTFAYRVKSLRTVTTIPARQPTSAPADVSFDMWNPAGDGIQNDYIKLLAALNYVKENNAVLVLNSNKTYYIGTPLNYSFAGSIRIRSSDTNKKAVIKLSDAFLFPFQMDAEQKPGTTTAAALIRPGQKSMLVASGVGFAAGDYIGLSSAMNWPLTSAVQKGEWNIVESVAGNVLLLRYPLKDTYALSEKVKVSKWKYASLDINGVEFISTDSGNRSTIGLSLRYLQNSRVTNCVVRNFQTTGVETRACYNFEFANNQVFGTNEVGMGYGFYPLAGFKFIVHDNTFTGGRKGVDVGGAGTLGPAREVSVYRNTTYGSGQTASKTDWFNLDVVGGQNMGYAVHEGAEGVSFTDNLSYNTCYGYQLRGKDITVTNNVVHGLCNFPFTTLAGYNHTYEGNEYKSLLTTNATAPDYKRYPRHIFFSDASSPGQIIFRNNKADFARDYGVVLNSSKVLSDVVISGNQYVFSTADASSTPYTVYWSGITKPINKLIVKANSATMASSGVRSSVMRLRRDNAYKNGALLNWETCQVEGLKADDLLTLTNKNTAAPLTYSFTNLLIDKQSKVAQVTGSITFKSTANCRPFLVGIPTIASPTDSEFRFECVTDKKFYIGKLYGNSEMQFGKNEFALMDAYKARTSYKLSVNVMYNTK